MSSDQAGQLTDLSTERSEEMRSILAAVQESLTIKKWHLVMVIGICAMILIPGGASSFNQPGMNLGFTSFADAGAPPEGYVGPRIILSEVVQWYDSSTFRDANGDKLPGRNRVSLLVNTHQLYFLPKLNDPLTGAQLGLDVIVPLVVGSVSTPGNPESNAGGLGDFIFSPVFQWNTHTLFGLPYYHRFQLHVTAPTADFDKRFVFNPGDISAILRPDPLVSALRELGDQLAPPIIAIMRPRWTELLEMSVRTTLVSGSRA
jgi:hypothetical protein